MRIDVNNINIYEVEYEVETPLIISRNISGIYLTGTSVRGAILTRLHETNKYGIEEEINRPTLIFHPAFPIDNIKGKEVMYKPAHPFIFECKICKSHIDMYGANTLDKRKLINKAVDSIPYKCKKEHLFTLKSLGGRLIAVIDGSIYKYSGKTIVLNSVGINKLLGSSEVNMLYSYHCIKPGSKFKGMIVQLSSYPDIANILKDAGSIIFLGRGGSRGFGHVKVKIKRSNNYIETRKKHIHESIDSYVILKALSPSFMLGLDENKGLVTRLNIRPSSKLKIRSSQTILTNKVRVSGFSLLSNIQKVSIVAVGEGSLICLDVEDATSDETVNQIIEWELLGIGPFNYAGFNMVEVLE